MTEPGAVVGSWELTRSIIYDCPALKMPQTWLQQLGATAQIVVLKGADDATAAHILAALNATPQPPAPVPAVPLTEREADLIKRLQAECDHAGINDCRLVPQFGQLRGPVAVREYSINAVIEGWRTAHNITGAPDHG